MSAKCLAEVLDQSERLQLLIEQSSRELSAQAVTMQLRDASQELMAVIQSLRTEIRDRTMVDHQLAAAVEQEEGSRNAALHDHLTGLPNRVLFTDRLEHGIAQAKRHRSILAVMFVDLDNFKTINDTYGHDTGDAVLKMISTRLRHGTRDDDTVSRHGGDEFLYLLNRVREENDISTIAVKVLRAIRAPCNLILQDVTVSPCMNASIGIAVFPRDGATAGALIKSADEAMYVAKESKSGFAFAQTGVGALCSVFSHGGPIEGGVAADAP